jgi:CO/xanthine dehydrogenase FAD-binding subunit
MRTFTYERPTTLAEAVDLLEEHGAAARPLAGGTDLIIRIRDGTVRPGTVIDLKRIRELRPAIREEDGRLTIGATTVMTDIAADARVRRWFVALAEAAAVVGAVQIRNRATIAGNLCNASPAADTATPLLAYGASVVAAGRAGTRRIGLDDFFVRSGETTLAPGELVTAIELPIPAGRTGAVHLRRTRRRGHDLAAVTMSCVIDAARITRLAYGSVGPRPILAVDASGVLADPDADATARDELLDRMLGAASPSHRSMRASPEYRLAMLRVLGRRAVAIALDRLNAP